MKSSSVRERVIERNVDKFVQESIDTYILSDTNEDTAVSQEKGVVEALEASLRRIIERS
jgi:hypothetical protein